MRVCRMKNLWQNKKESKKKTVKPDHNNNNFVWHKKNKSQLKQDYFSHKQLIY